MSKFWDRPLQFPAAHLSAYETCFHQWSVGGREKSRCVGLRMRWGCRFGDGQSYCRCSVTTIRSHSHVGSQALGEVHHCFVDVFYVAALPRWSAGPLSTYWASTGVNGTFPAYGASDVRRIKIWRVWEPIILLDEPGTVCLVLHDAWTLRNGDCLGSNTIILSDIFQVQQNSATKCLCSCLTVVCNFMQKIYAHCWNTRKKMSQEGATFCSPCTHVSNVISVVESSEYRI